MSFAVEPTARPEAGLSLRICYRSASGEIHLALPIDRISEALADTDGTLWVDIEDLGGRSSAWVESLFGEVFAFHPLAIEDALSEANVPKLDDWDRYLYLVFHAIDFDPESDDSPTPRAGRLPRPQLPGHLPHRADEPGGPGPAVRRA